MVKRTRIATSKAAKSKVQKTAEAVISSNPATRKTRNNAVNSVKEEDQPILEQNGVAAENIEMKVDEENKDQINGHYGTNGQEDQKEENEENEKAEITQKTPEEVKSLLDSLARAHPYGLLRNASRLSRRMAPRFEISKSTVTKDDKSEEVTSVVAHYINHVLSVEGIPGDNEKFATKVVSDLILEKLFPGEHDLDERTVALKENDLKIEFSIDDEWYAANCEKFNGFMERKMSSKINRIESNESYTDEQKKEKIASAEQDKSPIEPTYDDVYLAFDNPFFKVFYNVCSGYKYRKYHLSYEVDFFKTVDGVETPILKKQNKKVDENAESAEGDEDVKIEDEAENDLDQTADTINLNASVNDTDDNVSSFRVIITVNQNDKELFKIEHVDSSGIYKEARSEAAYLALEKLLADGIIEDVTRQELKRPNMYNGKSNRGRFNSRGPSRGGNRRGRGGRGGSRGGGRGGSKGGNKGGSNSNQNNKKKNNTENKNKNQKKKDSKTTQNPNEYYRSPAPANQQQQYQVHNQSFPSSSHQPQMMMVPVMMQPNGQMMIMPQNQGQQMMMMMPQNNTGASQQQQPQNNRPTNTNNRGKRGRGGNRGNYRGNKRAKQNN